MYWLLKKIVITTHIMNFVTFTQKKVIFKFKKSFFFLLYFFNSKWKHVLNKYKFIWLKEITFSAFYEWRKLFVSTSGSESGFVCPAPIQLRWTIIICIDTNYVFISILMCSLPYNAKKISVRLFIISFCVEVKLCWRWYNNDIGRSIVTLSVLIILL